MRANTVLPVKCVTNVRQTLTLRAGTAPGRVNKQQTQRDYFGDGHIQRGKTRTVKPTRKTYS
jgi:hypothetical protein